MKMSWSNISKTTRSVSSDIQTPRSGLKNEVQPNFLRLTSRCLDIRWNPEWSFGYSFSIEQSFLEKFKDKVPQNFMVISIRYPNRAYGVIFFVFSLWIINEFGNILKLISNNSSSDKPIACPHLGHMDAPWYRGKEQRVWRSKHVCLEIN